MILRQYFRGQATLTEIIITIILLMLSTVYADAAGGQSFGNKLITETGVIVGYGTGSIAGGNYEPVLLIYHMGGDMKQFFPGLEDHAGSLSLFLEPQINPAFRPETDVEFGISLGLKYQYPLSKKIATYVLGAVGPHYITVKTDEQKNGFLFSDAVGIGLSYFVTDTSALSLEYRFRHMSNAGIRSPNGGINTHFGAVGYSHFF